MEGKFYFADWKVTKSSHKLVLRENNLIKIQHSDLESAKASLFEEILNWNGDGDPQVEFVIEDSDDWFFLQPLSAVRIINFASLYEQGVCEACGFIKGKRNENIMEVEDLPKDGICYAQSNVQKITLIRNSLFEKLSRITNNSLEVRDVYHKGESCGYLELISIPDIKSVLPNDVEVNNEFRTTFHCLKCGRKSFQGNHAFNKFYIDGSSLRGKDIAVATPTPTDIGALILNGKLLNSSFKRSKTEKFLTKKVDLLQDNNFYIPDNIKKVDKIDWS